MTLLPTEGIEMIVACLPPRERFQVATHLRYRFIQKQTLRLFSLVPTTACNLGDIQLLELWKETIHGDAKVLCCCGPFYYGCCTECNLQHATLPHSFCCGFGHVMNLASIYGHIHILNWVKTTQLQLNYSCKALDCAASTAVLDWWKNSQWKLKYTHMAMDNATRDGHVEILQWWYDSGLELKYTDPSRCWIPYYTQETKTWWQRSGLIQ